MGYSLGVWHIATTNLLDSFVEQNGILNLYSFTSYYSNNGVNPTTGWANFDVSVCGIQRWMASIPGSALLTSLTIPATHDSAASYALSDKNLLVPDPTNLRAGGFIGIAQQLTIDQQLGIGVRFLDVRIAGDYCGASDVGILCTEVQFLSNVCLKSRYMCVHGSPPLRLTFGDVVTNVLLPAFNFLQSNPTEVIFMKFQDADSDCTVTDLTNLLSCSIPGLEVWTKNCPILINAGGYTLDQARGKVVAFLYGSLASSTPGSLQWPPDAPMPIQGSSVVRFGSSGPLDPSNCPSFPLWLFDDPDVGSLAQSVQSAFYSQTSSAYFKYIEGAAYCGDDTQIIAIGRLMKGQEESMLSQPFRASGAVLSVDYADSDWAASVLSVNFAPLPKQIPAALQDMRYPTPSQSQELLNNGVVRLVWQADGNLVLYDKYGASWAAGTNGRGASSLSWQADGNLVVYAGSGHALFATGTNGHQNNVLVLQYDCNLVIYTSVGVALWATGTDPCRI